MSNKEQRRKLGVLLVEYRKEFRCTKTAKTRDEIQDNAKGAIDFALYAGILADRVFKNARKSVNRWEVAS